MSKERSKLKEEKGPVVSTFKRDDLLEALSISSAALAPESEQVVPTFSGFCFDGERIIAHDDVIATSFPFKSDFRGVVSGHLFLKFLKACSSDDVEFTWEKEEKNLKVKCGSSQLNLPVTYVGEYPFQFPALYGDNIKDLTQEFFNGVDLCSRIVTDKGLATWLGGVLLDFGISLRMYSVSSTRDCICIYDLRKYGSKDKRETVVPVSFCKLALEMAKKFGVAGAKLAVRENYATVYFGNGAAAFGRAIKDDKLPDISAKVVGHLKKLNAPIRIQSGIRSAMSRAAAVFMDDDDCSLKIEGGKLRLRTELRGGSLNDTVALKSNHADVDVRVDPRLINRMLDQCESFQVLENCTVLTRASEFTYIVANKSM